MRVLRPGLLVWLACLLAVAPARAQGVGELVGVWLSPDWMLKGTHKYSEAEVRAVARKTMERLAEAGVNTVFLETWLRGYSIAPSIDRSGPTPKVVPYKPGVQGFPVYPHLNFPMRVDGDRVQDTLQIFVDEGMAKGIAVHAWTHMFYWMMDNTGAMLSWHAGPSLWSHRFSQWLLTESERLKGSPGAAPDTLALMHEAGLLFAKTTSAQALEKVLQKHGLDPDGRPMGILVRQALRAGAERPGFLLIHSVEDPFPAPRGKALRPVYLNPEDPQVRSELVRVIGDLVAGHPGLSGVHLDHIRYPVDGQGLPETLEIQDGAYNFYEAANPREVERYKACTAILARRSEALRSLVEQMREKVGFHRSLSAAVLPLYYRERDNGRFRLGGYDFSSQDWYTWKVDYVVPMLYYFHPYVIRSMLNLFTADLEKRYGRQTISVYPGISAMYLGTSGQLGANGWVFFDLKLARDVKLEKKEQTEDLDFGGE